MSPPPRPSDLAPEVLAQIDSEALARDCLDFVAVPSETGTEGPGSEFFADLLRRRGWEVTLDEAAPGRPNVAARLPRPGARAAERGDPAGGRNLVLNGHVDTIPIGASWPPRREGEWICGRGAEDMKGGLVAMVHAARAVEEVLGREGVALGGDVWLTGVVGHETPVGHKEGPLRLIERLRSGQLPADAILVCEGPAAIWRSSLGSAIFNLVLEAPRPPVHTSRVAYRENPVRALGPLLAALDLLDERLNAVPGHPLAGPDRINVGIVRAGDYPNRLPVRLELTGTRRWGPARSAEGVRAELEALARDAAREAGIELRATVELEGVREPFEVPTDHPLVGALRWAAQRVTGEPPEEVGLALVGDASLYVAEAGVPAVYFGPDYRTAHSDDERVSLPDLIRAARVYALTILRYGSPSSGG
jgi:acetylornithine deacetylase/succinyl-diaminopimelate desuccinylase-like protein